MLNHPPRFSVPDSIAGHARLFDTPGQAVIGTTRQGEIVYWSGTAAEIYGWSAEEVLGRNVLDVTPASTSREMASEIMARLAAGRSWSGRFRVRHRDGSELEVRVRDLPVRAPNGELVGIVGVSTARETARQPLARQLFD
jgi:PAS domain S-box-containing protein